MSLYNYIMHPSTTYNQLQIKLKIKTIIKYYISFRKLKIFFLLFFIFYNNKFLILKLI
jgi:hypothetical protein